MSLASDTGNALIHIEGTSGIVRLVLAVLVMAVVAGAIRIVTGLGNGREELTATARATVQLGLVGLIVTAVLSSWWLTAAFVTLMLTVASLTSGSRMKASVGRLWLFAPVTLGALPVTVALLAVGLLPVTPLSVVPMAGILIGNAMTATSLAGKRSLDSLEERHGELEAGLSLGLLPRDAALLVCQEPARLALIPGLDQTRTVGLVTLPGAFVGTLLGGASPLQAAALQLIVLVGVILAQSVAVALALELVVRGRLRRAG